MSAWRVCKPLHLGTRFVSKWHWSRGLAAAQPVKLIGNSSPAYSSLSYHGSNTKCLAYSSILPGSSYEKKFFVRFCSAAAESDATEPWRDVSHEQLKEMLSSGDIFLVDVRESHELAETGKIDERAVHIPLGSVPEAFGLSPRQFQQLYGVEMPDPDDGNIIFQCRGGVRSRQALRDAHKHGFARARHYLGGWLQWAELEKEGC